MVRTKVNGEEMDLPTNKTLLASLREKGVHIPGMCHNPDLSPYGSCRLCLVETNGRVMAACSMFPAENGQFRTAGDDLASLRRTSLELMLSDHYGDCIGPCQKGCPARSDVQGYLALTAEGRYHEAVKLMKEKYILPATLGRVCPAFCEEQCRRELVEGPVAIRQLKRFAADMDLEDSPWIPELPPPTGKKTAVVGGGPAGLACAFYLRTMGHDVILYEAMGDLGGWTRYGIPEYRMPKALLAKDIATVTGTGIDVRLNTRVGRDVKLEDLASGNDAVFMGIGAWAGRKLDVPGEGMPGVIQGIELLARLNRGEKVELGKKVVVIGGGNTAMDVVRTCRRLGCDVSLTYRRSEEEMPAAALEIEEAKEEGVDFRLLCAPVRVLGEDRVKGIELLIMDLGEPDASGRRRPVPRACSEFTVEADSVVLAIGQYNEDATLSSMGVASRKGNIEVDPLTLQTSIKGVFAGGDAVLGPSTVIESIEQGRRAALMMDLHMKGKLDMARMALKDASKGWEPTTTDPDVLKVVRDVAPYNHWKDVTEKDYIHIRRQEREKAIVRSPKARIRDFSEVEMTFKEKKALREVKRCMSCGCMDAFECRLREYSTIYGASQNALAGELTKVDIDSSHPHILLDNNKCVLCGQCVNLTQEITMEGAVDFNRRGFDTYVGPARGEHLGDSSGRMLGDMIDVCPTGALTEKLPYEKPGPWDAKPFPGVCSGCGMGCEMEYEVYNGMVLRARGRREGWNMGHLCDNGRFGRSWDLYVRAPMIRIDGRNKAIGADEALSILKQRMSDISIVLGGEVTNEEADAVIEFARGKGIPVGSMAKGGASTARFEDIPKAKRVLLKASLSRYPVLRPFLSEALRNGARLVRKRPDLIIAEAPFEPSEVPTIVLHEGLNDHGLLGLGLGTPPPTKNYLFIGTLKGMLPGYTIVLGYGKRADLVLPFPCFAEREGTVSNSAGTKLTFGKVRGARTGPDAPAFFAKGPDGKMLFSIP